MKKITAILLALTTLLAMLAFAGCGNSDGNADTTPSDEDTTPVTEATPAITSALDFYTKVWASFADDDKFPTVGGDMDNSTEDAPGQFTLNDDNAETFKYLLHVTDELYDMLDTDVVTMQHMMNTNTFSSAVAKLKDPTQASAFAESYKDALQAQHWMCGFPDLMVVISVGDYLVMAYGSEMNVNNLIAACEAVEPSSIVLVNAPALLE